MASIITPDVMNLQCQVIFIPLTRSHIAWKAGLRHPRFGLDWSEVFELVAFPCEPKSLAHSDIKSLCKKQALCLPPSVSAYPFLHLSELFQLFFLFSKPTMELMKRNSGGQSICE